MVLGHYQAAVECRGSFKPRISCATIIDDMEVTRISETFGPKSEPAPQVILPVSIESSKSLLFKSDTFSAPKYVSDGYLYRRREELRSLVWHLGYDVLVSYLGGCCSGLFGLCAA